MNTQFLEAIKKKQGREPHFYGRPLFMTVLESNKAADDLIAANRIFENPVSHGLYIAYASAAPVGAAQRTQVAGTQKVNAFTTANKPAKPVHVEEYVEAPVKVSETVVKPTSHSTTPMPEKVVQKAVEAAEAVKVETPITGVIKPTDDVKADIIEYLSSVYPASRLPQTIGEVFGRKFQAFSYKVRELLNEGVLIKEGLAYKFVPEAERVALDSMSPYQSRSLTRAILDYLSVNNHTQENIVEYAITKMPCATADIVKQHLMRGLKKNVIIRLPISDTYCCPQTYNIKTLCGLIEQAVLHGALTEDALVEKFMCARTTLSVAAQRLLQSEKIRYNSIGCSYRHASQDMRTASEKQPEATQVKENTIKVQEPEPVVEKCTATDSDEANVEEWTPEVDTTRLAREIQQGNKVSPLWSDTLKALGNKYGGVTQNILEEIRIFLEQK